MDSVQRTAAMAAMYRQGITLKAIGEKFGVTRERVRQILKTVGMNGKDGGAHFRSASKKSHDPDRLATRIRQKWGLDVETWRRLRADGTILRYTQQRNNARSRAIPFLLSFSQWYAIWQASGKLDLCGRGKGKFCMSRLNDAGAYELGNVHVQPCVENSREAVNKWRGKVKDHRGVFLLYPGARNPFLAQCGRTRIGFFATEQAAAEARAAFMAERGITESGLGKGRGWTHLKTAKARPYQMQGPGGARSYHATQEEAEAAYRAAVAAYLVKRSEPAEAGG